MKSTAVTVTVLVFMLLLLVFGNVEGWFWSRRRRRSRPPPPKIDCTYSTWRQWGPCSDYCNGNGIQIRRRTIKTPASGGGSCSNDIQQSRSCGSLNNGCSGPSVQCNSQDGSCSCSDPGYEISSKKCVDINECSTKQPCDQICTNTPGSYKCSCNKGYSLSGQHACTPKDCGPLTMPNCPLDSYQDSFSKACKKVLVSCPSGTQYQQFCTLYCPNGYRVGKITRKSGQRFGQDYGSADFASAKTTSYCSLQQSGNGVTWDISQDIGSYYCRRINDPPSNITLSNNALPEHSPSGFVIGKLSSVDSQSNQAFTYLVQSPSILFTCKGSKLVSTWKDPDLQGPIHLNNGIIYVKIRSKDHGNPPMWLDKTFLIQVTNVNDPPINITLSGKEVHENASIGYVVGSLKAVDKDDPPGTPPSSNFIWKMIDSDNGKFALNNKSEVIVAQKLDHETQTLHKISVTSTDRGQPPQTSTKYFLISVINVNELPGTITLSNMDVPENAAVGTMVGVLKATDDDSDPINFNISQSSVLTQSKFNVSTSTCSSLGQSCKADVTVIGDLDYESVSSYQLIVVASDKTGQTVNQWTIRVININEKPTNITLTGSHTVPELSPNGTVVGYFQVTDPDNKNTITQTHFCELESGDTEYFTIASDTVLEVSGVKILDYETKNLLSIIVKCTDTGKPSLSLTQTFTIKVKDINEPPTSLTLSNLKVPENSPNGTLVGILSNNDPEHAFQNYTYSIQGPKGTPFKLGGQGNRDVLVNGPLDFEKTPSLSLTIRVTDNGGLYKDGKFEIQLEDMNDPPTDIKLPGKNNKLMINENSQKDVLISQIMLVDQDTKDVATNCWLVDDIGGHLEIWNSVPPSLKTGPNATDYETSNKVLKIKLNCSDGHDKYVVQSFDIEIIDLNEKPTSIQLSNNTVPENQGNAVVGVVSVTDPDIGQAHHCTVCSIANGGACTSSQYFEVNGAMELKTKKALNFEAQHIHKIKISCSDIVSPPHKSLSVEKPFTIIVEDINESPSRLCDMPFNVSLHDSIGAVIEPLNGFDPDNQGNIKQALTYSMDNTLNGGVFVLKENHIFKNKDILAPQSFNLAITVTDDGRVVSGMLSNGYLYGKQQPLSTVFNCTVNVIDSQSTEEIRLSSNVISVMASNGAVVGTFTTIGGSLGETYSYKILNDILQPFKIEGDKLIVKQTKLPNSYISPGIIKEEMFEYIEIQSTNSHNKKLKKLMYIRIKNDAPKIPMCLVKKSINEKQPPQTTIGQILIEDPQPPKYSCSKTRCCSQLEKVPSGSFKYKCTVNNPEDNSVQPSINITAMFYVDNQYLLRSKISFLYADYASARGTINVMVSCHDILRPLHIIWKNIPVHIVECSGNGSCPSSSECAFCYNDGNCVDKDQNKYSCHCSKGFTGAQCKVDIDYCEQNLCKYGSTCHDMKTTFKCECVKGYSGVLCDRNVNLCGECGPDTLCVRFVEAGKRCLSSEYQVPVLVKGQKLTDRQLLEIEQEIAQSVEQKDKELSPKSAKRKRRASSTFYVETLKTNPIQDKTLLYLVIMDERNGYQPLTVHRACLLLAGTTKPCVNDKDCGALKASGKTCPVISTPKAQSGNRDGGMGIGTSTGVGLVVFGILALVIIGVCYYKRRHNRAKRTDQQVVYNCNRDDVGFNNPTYDEGNTNRTMELEEMFRDRLAKDNLIGHNLDPTSVKKRNDIKVLDNPLYCQTDNPTNEPAGAEACAPKVNKIEEKPGKELDQKTGKEFSVSLDDDNAYGSNGHAAKGDVVKDHSKGSNADSCDDKLDNKEKSRINIPFDHRPRYEEISTAFSKRKSDRQYENPTDLVVENPLYVTLMEDIPAKTADQEDPIYQNVVIQPNDSSGDTIINPLYGLPEDNQSTGDSAAAQEPIYEDIPAKKKSPKIRRRSLTRSVSSERAAGYKELQEGDDTFNGSHA